MKKLIRTSLSAIIFICCFTACADKPVSSSSPNVYMELSPSASPSPSAPPSTPPSTSPEAASPSPTYDDSVQWNKNPLIMFGGVTTYTGYANSGAAILEGRAILPRTENPAYEEYFTQLQEAFYEKCKQLSEQAKSDPESIENPYKVEVDFEIECNSGNILSIKRTETISTGGLHNETTVYCDNFRADTGEPHQLDDFFNCDRDTYTQRLLTEIREVLEEHKSEIYDNAMQLAEELFPYNEFCVTERGIIFYYQELDLAPFSVGTIPIEILWKEIEDIWKKPS